MVVYLVTNKITGQRYVGQTTSDLADRWSTHCSESSRCSALRDAITAHGADSFSLETLFMAESLEELCSKEREFIIDLNTLHPNGYNLNTGGTRPVFSEESKRKMSESASKRRPISEKTRSKLRSRMVGEKNHNFGKKFSEEHRRKLSLARIGKTPNKKI